MPKDNLDSRPNPDELLEKINRETKGKLTVFLGAAAGVGKTYALLEAAHARLAEGRKVIIGWIETHKRVETEKLVAGLPGILPTTITYRGKLLPEMDIDAILKEKPELVLVDELAHTNVPGSRHVRRYQDVEELLKAGIDVYTTLNIQHIESLNDVVAQITGVIVRETVPDYIVEQADNIQLVDIPPEELIKRLREGKVYVPGQAERALKKFFRPGNINALRELSLRFTASRVDKDLTEYMRSQRIQGPWPAAGRVMVGVSASPFSAQLIRAARRLSSGLQAELLAVHIEVPNRRFPLGEKERDRVARNMKLAEELGGKTLTVVGGNLGEEMLEVARSQNVTDIVIGKPGCGRLGELIHGSLAADLIRKGGEINIYVIRGEMEEEKSPGIRTRRPDKPPLPWTHYLIGLTMAAGITIFSWLFKRQLEPVNIALLYLLPVLFTAVWWGRWPSYVTAFISVLAFDFWFVPPFFTFSVYDIRYLWSFIIFLVVSFIIGGRTELLRAEAKSARQREKSIRALYRFTRDIAAIVDSEKIAQKLADHAGETIGRRTVVLTADSGGRLAVKGDYSPAGQQPLPDSEYAVAMWSFQHGQLAGRLTETLPGAAFLFVPIMVGASPGGVLGVEIANYIVTPEERRLIDAWAGLAAIAIERVKLAEQARRAALLAEADRLRSALFNSVSHELRTPLATIVGAASTLLDHSVQYSEEARRELLETVQEGATRMERLVANLLDTARLEGGLLQLKMDWCDIEDIIGAALQRLGESAKRYVIETELAAGLPFIRADCVLLEQVLVNLIDNAMKYSPVGSTITIKAVKEGPMIKIAVRDNGAGIPARDLPHIFEKFYRARQTKHTPGTGLGLSIGKSIVEAHGGRIGAKNRSEGGTVVSFSVPIKGDGGRASAKAGE